MPTPSSWPPKSAPRLFVDPTIVPGEPIRIEGPQAHYLLSVMRVGEGAFVIVCDNVTGEWMCTAADIAKRSLLLVPVRKLREREETPDLWLCPALIKKPRFDIILEKATELGVRRIAPFIARRSVADKLNPDRSRAITKEAAEQCARTALPNLADPVKLEILLDDWPADRTVYFADENGGQPIAAAIQAQTGPAAILIGPEGGFDNSERSLIGAHPQSIAVTLGPHILRAETATIAACAIWLALQPAPPVLPR